MIDKIQFILKLLLLLLIYLFIKIQTTLVWSKAVIIATIEFTIYNKNVVNSIAVINIQAIGLGS